MYYQKYHANEDCDAGCFDGEEDILVGSLPANSTSFVCHFDECLSRPTFVMATKDGGVSDTSNTVVIP